MEINLDGVIAQTIQLALTPVFVLVAIGNILNILSNRLARVVDRSRFLLKSHARTSGMEHDAVVREIRIVDRRIRLINSAMLLLVMSGLSIGITVAMLFVEEVFSASLQNAAAAFFFASIALLMAALLSFLRETRVATNALKIPETYLELERKL